MFSHKNFSLLTLNLHTYEQHPRHCSFDTMHQHEREVQIIAEAIAHLKIDVICFQEVGVDHRKDNYMSRNITVSCIDVPWFGLLHVANVHLSWAHHGFYEEYDNLRKLIHSRLHFGVRGDFMVGDFNAPAGEHAYKHIAGKMEYVDQFYELHPHRFYEPSYMRNFLGR